jgi:hypothetical protein
MEQIPSREANSHSASQEILRLLRDLNIYYRVHNSSPLVSILSQMNPVHYFPPYFPTIHSNVTILNMPRSSEWSLPFTFSDQNCLWISHVSHACYMPCQCHPPWLDHSSNICWSVQLMKLLIMQSSLASHHFLPHDDGIFAASTAVNDANICQNEIWILYQVNLLTKWAKKWFNTLTARFPLLLWGVDRKAYVWIRWTGATAWRRLWRFWIGGFT